MVKLKAFFIYFYLIHSSISSTTDKNQMQYSEGTIEAKYKLPTVNISVNSLGGNFTGSHYTVKSSLSRVLDFYNTEMLASSWNGVKESLSEGCQKDIEAYIQGLSKAENWALKSKLNNLITVYQFIFNKIEREQFLIVD